MIILSPPLSLYKARGTTDPLIRAMTTAEPHVRRWWEDTWAAFQAALPGEWGLSSLPTILREAWQTYGLARLQDLQDLLQRLAQAVSRSELPPLLPVALGMAQAVQAIETSLAQVPTTMARLPQVLLPEVAVLTIPQQGALARMAEGMAQEVALTPAHVERTLRTQAKAQLVTRTNGLASQLTWQAGQAGQQAGWQQQAQVGTLGAGTRRFWRVRLDERLCPRCASIPLLNEAGVGLSEPFQSSEGAIMSPPRHIACRCNVEIH